MSEHDLHVAAARFLDLALPSGTIHAAVDSAGKASVRIGARLKQRGGRKGFPDHLILHQGRTVFIEFKNHRGTVTRDQQAFHWLLREAGFRVYVVRSVDDLIEVLRQEGIESRGRIVV